VRRVFRRFAGWSTHPRSAAAADPVARGCWGYSAALLAGHRLVRTLPTGTALAFKFTRGSWATVEKGDGGVEIPNREHLVTGSATLELTVLTWADML
jgi:hypothetical protein